MALDDTPNKLESVWIQRNTENQYYEQINISGSDLIVYHSSSGEIQAEKISVFAEKYNLGGTSGKAKVSVADTTSDYLFSKLAAGSNIALTILNPGANEVIRIDSSGGAVSDQATLATQSLHSTQSLYATQSLSSSYALSASYVLSASVSNTSISASWAPPPNLTAYLSSSWTGSVNSRFSGTSSYALSSSQAISASWAPVPQFPSLSSYLSSSWTGSNTSQFAGTSSFAVSASWAPSNGGTGLSTGSTYPITASFSVSSSNALTASYALGISASNIIGTVPTSAFSYTSSYAITSSQANTASFAVSASWAPVPQFPSLSSYLSSSWTGSSTSQFAGTSSYSVSSSRAISASWAPVPQFPSLNSYLSSSWTGSSNSQFAGTSSFALTSSYSLGVSASNIIGTVPTAAYAYTASYSSITIIEQMYTTQSLWSTQSLSSISSSWASSSIFSTSASYWNSSSVNTWVSSNFQLKIATGSLLPITSSYSISASFVDVSNFSTTSIQTINIGINTTTTDYEFSLIFISGSSGYSTPRVDSNNRLTFNPFTDTLINAGIISASAFSGSLGGTASFAISASWAPSLGTGLQTGSTYPITASYALSSSTSQFATNAESASYISDATSYRQYVFTPSSVVSASSLSQPRGSIIHANVGNKIYLYGGWNSTGRQNTIWTASVDSPEKVGNSGATLPYTASNADVLIISGTMYIVGGYSSTAPIGTIITASVSNPLSWSVASTIPNSIKIGGLKSIISGSTIWYMFGQDAAGYNTASFTASVSSPHILGFAGTINIGMVNNAVIPIGNTIYSLTGTTRGDATFTPSQRVMTASISNPLLWGTGSSVVGMAGGQTPVLAIGDVHYIFGGYTGGSTVTSTIYAFSGSSPLTLINTPYSIPTATHYHVGLALTNSLGVPYVVLYGGGLGNSTDGVTYIFTASVSTFTALNQPFDYSKYTEWYTLMDKVGVPAPGVQYAKFSLSSSYASSSLSSSYSISSSYSLTASYAGTSSYAVTASQSNTSSFSVTASYWNSSSINTWTSNNFQNKIATGSTLPITASHAITSSYSFTASFWDSSSINTWTSNNFQLKIATGSLMPVTSSQSITSSYSFTASFWDSSSVNTWASNNFQFKIVTGSTLPITASFVVSASWARSASYWDSSSVNTWTSNNFQFKIATGSLIPVTASHSITASYSFTASFWDSSSILSILNNKQWNISTGSTLPITTSHAITASYVAGGVLSSSYSTTTSFIGQGDPNYVPVWTNWTPASRGLSYTSSIYQSVGNIGIGVITNIDQAKLSVVHSTGSLSGTSYGVYETFTATPQSATTASLIAHKINAIGSGGSNIAYTNSNYGLIGLWVDSKYIQNSSTATASLIQGLRIDAQNSSSLDGGGLVSKLIGLNVQLTNAHVGSGNTEYGITDAYSIYINPLIGSNGVSGNKYGVYQEGALDTNYLAGAVGIGSDPNVAPTEFKLKVHGDTGPSTDRTYDLGSTSNYWNRAYVNSLTGSHHGTSSVATSASYALSASYSLTSSYAVTASYISSAFSIVGTSSFTLFATNSMYAWTASYLYTSTGVLYFLSSSAAASGTSSVAFIPTSSFDCCFIQYLAKSRPNLRVGNLNAVWSGSSISHAETSTTDLGNTNGLTLTFVLSGPNAILQAENSSPTTYQIKATITSM